MIFAHFRTGLRGACHELPAAGPATVSRLDLGQDFGLANPKKVNFGLGPENGLPETFRFVQVVSCKVKMGSLVIFWQQRLLPSNPPMNGISIQCSSYCWSMYSYLRCSKGGLQISRCYVWVGFYLIYYCSCGSWGYFGRASTSRTSCCHVKCSPFVNDLPHSGLMELKSFWDDCIAFPRLMCCPRPDVLWDLLSSRHGVLRIHLNG